MSLLHADEAIHKLGFNLNLIASKVVEGFITGLHKSPFHGFSVEFSEHYPYNQGESIRNIDWRLYGRTDKLFVKRFEEETNVRCYFVLDTSSSMRYPKDSRTNKLLFSVYSIASLIHLLKKQRDAFSLVLCNEKIEALTPARSTTRHKNHLFSLLDKTIKEEEQAVKTNLSDCLHDLSERIHPRSMIVVFSDCIENLYLENNGADFFSALKHLTFKKHEVVLFQVQETNTEVDFSFKNEPRYFIDLETNEKIKVHPNAVRPLYKNMLTKIGERIKDECLKVGIHFSHADINKGFYPILFTFLLNQQAMHKKT